MFPIQFVDVWIFEATGDHSCDDCLATPRYQLENLTPLHPRCDCISWPTQVPGLIEYGEIRWDDMGYTELGRVPANSAVNHGDSSMTHSVGNTVQTEVSVTVTLTENVGVSAEVIEASIEQSMEATTSVTVTQELTDQIEIPPHSRVTVYRVTYSGELLLYQERSMKHPDFNDLEIEELDLGIFQVGTASYRFFGLDYEIEPL